MKFRHYVRAPVQLDANVRKPSLAVHQVLIVTSLTRVVDQADHEENHWTVHIKFAFIFEVKKGWEHLQQLMVQTQACHGPGVVYLVSPKSSQFNCFAISLQVSIVALKYKFVVYWGNDVRYYW